jgi:hypothetical protein
VAGIVSNVAAGGEGGDGSGPSGSVMDRWSMGKLRNLGQRSRVARARG